MCIICDEEYDEYKDITELICFECKNVTIIPFLPNLTFLDCGRCINLRSIPKLPELVKLWCEGCTSLTSIPKLPKLTELICSNCTKLTLIQKLPRLTNLWCSNCTCLTSILELPRLLEFRCNNRTKSLTSISKLQMLDWYTKDWLTNLVNKNISRINQQILSLFLVLDYDQNSAVYNCFHRSKIGDINPIRYLVKEYL